MLDEKNIINTGLRGVPVASTKISHVDGQAGKLIYRGYNIFDLVGKVTFEEVTHLLVFEALPSEAELALLRERLVALRPLPDAIVAGLAAHAPDTTPMDVLQATLPLLAYHDSGAGVLDFHHSVDAALSLIVKTASIAAAWHRIRQGLAPVAPDPALPHAANFLYTLTGERPSENAARAFDAALVLHAEHSFNASTFTARQVASTRASMYAAVAAAVGSLSGELHGGANARVMEMLKTIGSVEAIDGYLADLMDKGGKIMGLGHAVYKTGDPRARILAPMSKALGEAGGEPQWYAMSEVLERKGKAIMKERKGMDVYPNVDFYSASLYHAMGIPTDLFTPVFAVARMAGWTAHVLEEHYGLASGKPVLYRPSAEYVADYCGPAECAFVPMSER